MIYGTEEYDLLLKKIIKDNLRHSLYKEACEHAEEMSWHFYGSRPTELLERSRPREDDEVTKYRLENYEPTTKSEADKAVTIVSKIFNPNLYSIRWKEDNPSIKELKAYTLEYYPIYNSVVNYTKDVLLRKMLSDPNGIVAVKLFKMPESQTESPQPVLTVFGSPSIFWEDEDGYLVNTKIETVTVQGRERTIYTFEYYDRTRYVEFEAYMLSEKEIAVTEMSIYQHNFKEIPAWKLRGMSEDKNDGRIIYKSFFSSAAPYWNLAIIHESDLFGAYINHLHPIRVELGEECGYRWKKTGARCSGGRIKLEDGDIECPSCRGSGYKSVQSSYGKYVYNKAKLDEFQGKFEPVSYVNVPTDATKMLEERVAALKVKGMCSINMDIEDKVGDNQSGVAKVIDRSAQYDTMFTIGVVTFDVHLPNAYYFINKYMFAVSQGPSIDNNLPEISKPTQFDVYTPAEMVSNFEVAKKSGIDRNFLQLKQIEILSKDLTTNPDLKNFSILLLDLDPLPGMTQMEIDLAVTKGYTSKTDAVIHFNLKAFVERAMRENKGFMEMTKEDKLVILEKYALEFINKNKPVLDVTMIPN